MAHHHSHNHAHKPSAGGHGAHGHSHSFKAGPILVVSLILTFGFAFVEAIVGWRANSLALLSDAGHMLTDGFALVLAAAAAWISQKPPSKRHSYGLERAEVLGAWLSSIFVMVVVIGIFIEALERFRAPQPVQGSSVILVASLGAAINIVIAWLLSRTERTLNIRAAILHVMGDLLGSIAALISGLVIYYTDWLPIDPLLSLFICILISISSLRLLKETIHVLMEGVPLHLDLHEVGTAMAKTAQVKAVHDLHIWALSSGKVALSAHVEVTDMGHWEMVLKHLQDLLSGRYGIEHVTLQPETSMQVVSMVQFPRPDFKH